MRSNHTSDCSDYLIYSDFECSRDIIFYQRWAAERPLLPYASVLAYLASIYVGQAFMKNRKPLNLRWALFAWNSGLTCLAFIGIFRGIIEVGQFVTRQGFLASMCQSRTDRVAGFWVFVFLMSKFLELGDTFFLVARKRNVMFLHW